MAFVSRAVAHGIGRCPRKHGRAHGLLLRPSGLLRLHRHRRPRGSDVTAAAVVRRFLGRARRLRQRRRPGGVGPRRFDARRRSTGEAQSFSAHAEVTELAKPMP